VDFQRPATVLSTARSTVTHTHEQREREVEREREGQGVAQGRDESSAELEF
jgi:hypothetical protein